MFVDASSFPRGLLFSLCGSQSAAFGYDLTTGRFKGFRHYVPIKVPRLLPGSLLILWVKNFFGCEISSLQVSGLEWLDCGGTSGTGGDPEVFVVDPPVLDNP